MTKVIKVSISFVIITLDLAFLEKWWSMFIEGRYWEHAPFLSTVVFGVGLPIIMISLSIFGFWAISQLKHLK